MPTAQEILNSEFLEDDIQDSNETLELFKFMRDSSVPLSESQMKAMFLLEENDLNDLSLLIRVNQRRSTPRDVYFKLLDKLTLADRIKGNAKFSHLMKANSNPAESLKASDVKMEKMSKRELDR